MTSLSTHFSVVDAPERGRFEIRAGEKLAGFTVYQRRPGEIAFVHTEVDPSFEGQGAGSRLIASALDTAREQGLVVLPYCPFVRGYIARHPDAYLDLVPRDRRKSFGLASDD
jgi:predicted GNAT family acetyltransferase